MKKLFLVGALVAVFALVSNTASAGIPIIYSNGQTAVKTVALPDSVTVNDNHVNFGVAFKQFAIFWIPVWNYGETEYVVLDDKENTYWSLDEEELAWLNEEYGINTEKSPSIPFWHRTGGKAIWGGLILLLIWGGVKSKGDDDEENAVESQPQPVEKQEK